MLSGPYIKNLQFFILYIKNKVHSIVDSLHKESTIEYKNFNCHSPFT